MHIRTHQKDISHDIGERDGAGTPYFIPVRGMVSEVCWSAAWIVRILNPHELSELNIGSTPDGTEKYEDGAKDDIEISPLFICDLEQVNERLHVETDLSTCGTDKRHLSLSSHRK